MEIQWHDRESNRNSRKLFHEIFTNLSPEYSEITFPPFNLIYLFISSRKLSLKRTFGRTMFFLTRTVPCHSWSPNERHETILNRFIGANNWHRTHVDKESWCWARLKGKDVKKFVRSGIRTHAHRSGLRPERSALDRSAILTCLFGWNIKRRNRPYPEYYAWETGLPVLNLPGS